MPAQHLSLALIGAQPTYLLAQPHEAVCNCVPAKALADRVRGSESVVPEHHTTQNDCVGD